MPRLELTDRFVTGAKSPNSERVDFFDANTPGLALRVSPGGHKSWAFTFTSPKDGRRARVTLGRYPGTSLARARTLAAEARGNVDAGRDPRDVLAASEAAALTVAGLFDSWNEKHVATLRSAKEIERRITRNVIGVIGSVRLADLHRREINRVLDPIIARGRHIEANRVFEDMRAMFRWAVKRGDLDSSPMEGMAKPSAERTRERVLSDDEIRAIWAAMPKALARSKACQRILMLCLITGQRVGEVAGMAQAELDLKRALWSLPGARTKNGRAHVVPLSQMAVELIEEALEEAGEGAFVFPSGEAGLSGHAVATTLRRAQIGSKDKPLGRFGIPHFTAHDLRRTAITGMAQLGVEPIVIGAVANHLSVTKASVTFAHYVQHSYESEKRDALDLWAERLAAIIEGDAAKVLPMRTRRP